MATILPHPPVFHINSSSVAENWLEWELPWNAYKVVIGVDERLKLPKKLHLLL